MFRSDDFIYIFQLGTSPQTTGSAISHSQVLDPSPGIPLATPSMTTLDHSAPLLNSDMYPMGDLLDYSDQNTYDFFQMLLPTTGPGATDWQAGGVDMTEGVDDMMGWGTGGPATGW